MREIKFRAWDKNAYKMAEVTQIIFSKVQHTLVKYRYKTDNGKVKDEASHIDKKGHGTIVLLQYTGLKDKKGAVCKFGNRRLITEDGITIDIQCFYFQIGDRKTNPVVVNYKGMHDLEIMEIRGNIYENPELLEVE